MIASIILGMGLLLLQSTLFSYNGSACINNFKCPFNGCSFIHTIFGVVADITPPVALAAYAGAGIAGANSMKTGFQAVKLALAAFIVPYILPLILHYY